MLALRNYITNALNALYERIFGHAMSDKMRQFVSHLSWSFAGGLTASIIMLGVNILAGRLLGPEEYGKYNLVITWSQLMMIPLLFGMDNASLRAAALAKTPQERAKQVGSALAFFSLMSLILVIGVVSFTAFEQNRLRIDTHLLWLSVGVAILFALKLLLDGFIRAFDFFKYQSLSRIMETVMVVGLFVTLFFTGQRQANYADYITTLLGGSLVLILLYTRVIWPYIWRFDMSALKNQLAYGQVLLVGNLLGTLFNSLDKLIIARYLSIFELGVYGAYFTASTNLIAQGVQMFINVFFPSVTKSQNPAAITRNINRLALLAFVPAVLLFTGLIAGILTLFGREYGLRWNLVVSFAVLAVLQTLLTIYASIIIAVSKQLYRTYLVYLNSFNALHIVAYAVMIYYHATSIQVLVTLLTINVAAAIIVQVRLLTHYKPTPA